jgi:exonuclease SbcC
MKLRSLSLQLFRQHAASVVHFPDGLIGILGANGAGKTTILEAIGFALFGSRALRGRIEDVRTRFAQPKSGRGRKDQDLRVELTLEHEGVLFRIERTLTDADLYVGGEPKPVAAGNREVSARIGAIVGMSHDEFVATYCTEQKGLEFLSGKKGATEREKFILRMMGYDRLEQVQDLLRDDRKEKRSVLSGYEASLGTREELEHRLAQEQQELAAIRAKHDESSAALKKGEAEFGALRERMVKLEELRSRHLREKEIVQALSVRKEEREKRLSALADTQSLTEEQLARALKPLAGGLGLEEALAAAKRRVFETRESLAAATEANRKTELEWREAVSKARAERDGVTQQAEQLRTRAKRAGGLKAGSDCPTCGQSLGDSFRQVQEHFAAEEQKLLKRRAELEEALKAVSVEPQALSKLGCDQREIEQSLRSGEAKLQELSACLQLEAKLSEMAREREAVLADLEMAQQNLSQASERLSSLRFSEESYSKEKGSHDAAQRLVEVQRLQRVRLEGEVNTKEALVQRTKDDIVKFDERCLEVERLRREVRILDECDRILTDFRKFVNSSIRPRMAELASEYLADLTDGRYSAVELAEDFTPTVVEDGEAKRVISGGEEDILNLCMRISLSHMLAERAGQNFSLLMLDEVFGSLDEGRRGNVLSLLEKLRKRFEQIVIITHLDDIKDGVQHMIQVEYDEASGAAYVVPASEVPEELAIALYV